MLTLFHVDHVYSIAGLQLLKGDKKYVVLNLGIEVPDVLTKDIISKAKKNGGRIRQASFGKKNDGKRRMLLPEGFSADWKALKSSMDDLRTDLDAAFLKLVFCRCTVQPFAVQCKTKCCCRNRVIFLFLTQCISQISNAL